MTDGTTTWSYTYDANGMRTSRTNGTTTYNYVYNGSQLTQMTVGNDTLYFTYGILGPNTVTWNGATYYYTVNAQGDVTGILDGDGNLVVFYYWDNGWGYNPISDGPLASTLGTLNPLRYRSYVYDTETGYYYLQSRYYDPEIGRFINADGLIATGQGLVGNNMFAYCGNNPTMGYDPTGCWDWGIFTDIAVTFVATVTAVGVGKCVGIATYLGTNSLSKAASAAIVAEMVTFGAINNIVNTVYYNCISDGVAKIETNPDRSTYVDEYVTRWERLDYTKQETGEECYNLNAWRYNSEYSLHMYGWYATSWAKDTSTPLFSSFAEASYSADVDPHTWDRRPYVNIGTLALGILGI